MGEGETVEQKSLVPYDEVEEPKTNEESVDEDGQGQAEQEKEEEKPKIDPTKFINSFSETVVEEVKPKLKLPTLIFNEKTVELAPREEVKPETEASEAKIDVHKENTPELMVNPSRAQNLETDSKKQQDKPAERSSRHKEAKVEVDKKEVEAAAPSKWDLEESFTGEEFALQQRLQGRVQRDGDGKSAEGFEGGTNNCSEEGIGEYQREGKGRCCQEKEEVDKKWLRS